MNEHEATLHRRAWDAIPWVVAGAASTDEARCVEEHLPRCAECRAEWALQLRVHAGLDASLPAANRLPKTQPSWQDMSARLELADPVDPALAARAASSAHDPGRGDPAVRALARVIRPQAAPAVPIKPTLQRWTNWLVVAVLVQAVGLGALGLALQDRNSDPAYRPYSQPPAAPATRIAARLRVVPAPGMDFAALRQLLAQTRLVAVEVGPDGSSLALAAADGDPRTLAAALPLLQASPLVLLAEPQAMPTRPLLMPAEPVVGER